MEKYVVYNWETGKMAGKRAFTKLESANKRAEELTVASGEVYMVATELAYKSRQHSVKMVSRTNIMSGNSYMERVDTPLYLSPASETYWSM